MCSDNVRVRVALIASCMALAAGCGARASVQTKPPLAVNAATLYPLQLGAAWSYDVDGGDGQALLATARVLRVENGVAEVANGQALLRYRLLPEGLERADRGGFLLKPPFTLNASWSSAPTTTARIVAVDQPLTTAAGSFRACVVIEERNAASGQSVVTTYCPGVGPVRVVSEMEVRGRALRVIATLRGFATDAQ